jgi:hypothetical protein
MNQKQTIKEMLKDTKTLFVTWLPSPGFQESAELLEGEDLADSISNGLLTLEILTNPTFPGQNTSLAHMWRGYEAALRTYIDILVDEMRSRPQEDDEYAQESANKILGHLEALYPMKGITRMIQYPQWLGSPGFHQSHQANLVCLNSQYYSQYKWKQQECELVWPISLKS